MSEHQMIGQSAEFLRVVHAARMVAPANVSVLMNGERGTGKEVLAREIHALSQQRKGAFRVIKCALLDDLSLFAESTCCTLFLDDITQLKSHLQGELSALLESGMASDCRVIASVDGDLQPLVAKGQFREDLYYRLNIVPLELPPLRGRGSDLMLLLKAFIKTFARNHGRTAPSFSAGAKNLLKAYAWPGNIRELRNFAERMVILMPGKTLQPENLPEEMKRAPADTALAGFQLPEGGIDLNALEADILQQALARAGGNRSKAARMLRISRDTFLYRLQKFAIEA
jgi:DNA-binding NtrC family response regulator